MTETNSRSIHGRQGPIGGSMGHTSAEEGTRGSGSVANADPWLTVDDVAEQLRVPRGFVYEAVRLNKIRHARIGRKIRIRESWVNDLLEMSVAA